MSSERNSDRLPKIKNQSDRLSRVPSGKIESALREVSEYRSEIIRKQKGSNEPVGWWLRTATHAAVMTLYYELKPYRSADALNEFWDTAELWPISDCPYLRERHLGSERRIDIQLNDAGGFDVSVSDTLTAPEGFEDWLTGLGTLEVYEGMTTTRKRKRPGLGRGHEESEEPAILTADQLLRASEVLDRAAMRLGFGVDEPTTIDIDDL